MCNYSWLTSYQKQRKGDELTTSSVRAAGNIPVGERARVAAGSMVLKPVAADMLVAGNPAKVIGKLVDVGKDGNGHHIV